MNVHSKSTQRYTANSVTTYMLAARRSIRVRGRAKKRKGLVCKGESQSQERRLNYLQRQTFEATVPLASSDLNYPSNYKSAHNRREEKRWLEVQKTHKANFFMPGLRKVDRCTYCDDSVGSRRSNKHCPTHYFSAGLHSFQSFCHDVVCLCCSLFLLCLGEVMGL